MPELVDVVDENDVVLGQCNREERARKGIITRHVLVSLRTSADDHILQVRALSKPDFPACYDFAAGGLVHAGETYGVAAVRELREKLGVRCPLDFRTKYLRHIASARGELRLHTSLFTGVYDGDFRPNEEVQSVMIVTPKQLETMLSERQGGVEQYFIDELNALKEYL